MNITEQQVDRLIASRCTFLTNKDDIKRTGTTVRGNALCVSTCGVLTFWNGVWTLTPLTENGDWSLLEKELKHHDFTCPTCGGHYFRTNQAPRREDEKRCCKSCDFKWSPSEDKNIFKTQTVEEYMAEYEGPKNVV